MKLLYFWFSLCSTLSVYTQSFTPYSLLDTSMIEYTGAFRLSSNMYGISSLAYVEGPIAYNPDNHSLFIVGHPYQQAIAEFPIPNIMDEDLINLYIAVPAQGFDTLLFHTDLVNEESLDRIGGMYYIGDEQYSMIVNAYEYYDAPADNHTSTYIMRGVNDFSHTQVEGIDTIYSAAAHLSGWISDIPLQYQTLFGGNLIFGHSSGIPIIGRASVGPSAFVMNIDLENPELGNLQFVERILDFSLTNPLDADLSNTSLNNELWTHLSRVVYGFIVPGTKTYFTLGNSGGHESGVCYKCTQSDGNLCGGYCTPDPEDNYSYYWLWNLDDLLEVQAGMKAPHEILPYDYGIFKTRFGNSDHLVIGASFDQISRNLYVSIGGVDTLQGTYQFPPVIEVYQFPDQITSTIMTEQDHIEIFPNPTANFFIIAGDLDNYQLKILNSTGQILQEKSLSGFQETVDITDFPQSFLFIQVIHNSNQEIFVQKILKSN